MKRLAIICVLVLLFGTINAAADQWMAPSPFTISSDDGSRVFRFDPDSETIDGRAVLYDNSNPPKVIYTVKDISSWAYESNFYFSDDFKNFVFFPPAGFDIAFEFYSNGELQKTYYINELVRLSWVIPKSTSKAWWLGFDADIVQRQNIVMFETVEGLTYNFDIATGQFVDEKGSLNTLWVKVRLLLPFIMTGLFIAGVVLLLVIRHNNKRKV